MQTKTKTTYSSQVKGPWDDETSTLTERPKGFPKKKKPKKNVRAKR